LGAPGSFKRLLGGTGGTELINVDLMSARIRLAKTLLEVVTGWRFVLGPNAPALAIMSKHSGVGNER